MNEPHTSDGAQDASVGDVRQRPKKLSFLIWLALIVFGVVVPVMSTVVSLRIIQRSRFNVEAESVWSRPFVVEFVQRGEAGDVDGAYDMCTSDFRGGTSRQQLAERFERLGEAGEFESLGGMSRTRIRKAFGETRKDVSFDGSFKAQAVLLSFVFHDEGRGPLIEEFEFELQDD